MTTSTEDNASAATLNPAPAGRWIDGLSEDRPAVELLEAIVRQRWLGVLYYLPAAAGEETRDVEPVHKLRVSSRRLAAILDVLAEGVPQAPRKKLVRLADRIRRTCGAARDLDVRRQFLEGMLPHASVEDAAAIELLCETTVKCRNREQKKLRRRLPRCERKLKKAGVELLDSLESIRRKERPAPSTFLQLGVRALTNELAALWSCAEVDIESASTLHQLRIACKHLRYAFEVFMPALPAVFREDHYPQLERMQDLLGAIHDADQAAHAVRRRRKKWRWRWKAGDWGAGRLSAFPWNELQAGLEAVLLAYALKADQARADFFDTWPGFAGSTFRHPVTQLLTRLAASSSPETAP